MNAPKLVPKFMLDKQRDKNKALQDSHDRLLTELGSAAMALEEAYKLLSAARIDGTPMKGTASIMATHATRCHQAIAQARSLKGGE